MMQQKPSDSAGKLAEMIKKAIADCELSTSEYTEIMTRSGFKTFIRAQNQGGRQI
jgi:hypothetical protein